MKLDSDGNLLVNSGGGSEDASAANQITTIERITEIRDRLPTTVSNQDTLEVIASSLGSVDSLTAYGLTDGYETTYSWNIISLLRGIFDRLTIDSQHILGARNALDAIFAKANSSPSTLQDFSGVITTPLLSIYNATSLNTRKYLFIQNLPIEPIGNLWINFGEQAEVGNGSIFLAPGESFVLEGTAIPTHNISILGTVAGMQFTYKEG